MPFWRKLNILKPNFKAKIRGIASLADSLISIFPAVPLGKLNSKKRHSLTPGWLQICTDANETGWDASDGETLTGDASHNYFGIKGSILGIKTLP